MYRRQVVGARMPGSQPVIKKVAGVPNDFIEINSLGISVNGESVANTAQRRKDSSGNRLADYYLSRALKHGEVLLVSNYSSISWDSRYFGPVPASSILSPVKPLLIFD